MICCLALLLNALVLPTAELKVEVLGDHRVLQPKTEAPLPGLPGTHHVALLERHLVFSH